MNTITRIGLFWIARAYAWLTERLYHELAWVYDPVSWLVSLGGWDYIRKWSLDYLVGSKVLEIGFGTGELLFELTRRGYSTFGLDPSPQMQRVVNRKCQRCSVWLPRVRASSQHIPFPDDTFDSVVATFPASYIFDPGTWIEVSRLLRTTDGSAQGTWGRFIVVGICASAAGTPRLPLAVFSFGLPMDEILSRCQQLATGANLDLRVEHSIYKGLKRSV
jgi:ubiquinone/menaquinone biosynthesis C-methylase UbiE